MRKLCLASILATSVALAAPPAKLSRELLDADLSANVKVIVQWKQVPSAQQEQKVLKRGGALGRRLRFIKSGAYSVPAAALNDLAKEPDVAYISLDRPVKSSLDYTAAAINAKTAWSAGYTGVGIGVAVLDSGMVKSPDLASNNNIVYNQDFTGEIKSNANVTDTNNAPDEYGHGQHVAGIIASSGKSSTCGDCTRPLIGIAPGANLINLRVLNENGEGTDSMVIAAIDEAITLKSKYNIRIINLSLGRPVYESYTVDPLCQAVEQAWRAGIVVVVAAGNDGRDNSFGTSGYGTITAPGNDPFVITVGAMKTLGTYTRTDDLIASYSSKGPTRIDGVVKPDLVAPGNQVVSLLAANNATLVKTYPTNIPPTDYYQGKNSKPSNAYFTLNGTSMATPVVSGAAADLLQAQPNLTPDQVKARFMKNAYKTFPASSTATDPTTGQMYVSYYDIFTVGAGYLDLAAALADTSVSGGTAESPSVTYSSSNGSVTFVVPNGAVWSSQGVWGVQGVWGSQGVWGTQGVWGSEAVLATRGVWGYSVTLGQSLISSLQGVWGSQGVWGMSNEAASASALVSIAGEN